MSSSPPPQVALSPTPEPQRTHIPELDGIRGLAALAVYCHHALDTSIPSPERWNSVVSFVARVSVLGAYGVDLFFVLSGFLITSIILVDRDRPHFYWNFYWKRALRIFPLYLVALTALAIFLPAARRYALLAALFIVNFAQVFHVPSAGPFWTLAIEEQFYLVWPQCSRRLSVAGLGHLALGVALGCLVLRLFAALVGHHNYEFTFFHCDAIALGSLLACQMKLRRTPALLTRLYAPRLPWTSAGGALLSLLPLLLPQEGLLFLIGAALQLTGISLLGYSIVRLAVERSGSPPLALLRSPVLIFFGLISYCFYISHFYVLVAYDAVAGPLPIDDMGRYTLRVLVTLAATVAICLLSRHLIELPAMSLRRYVLRRTQSPASATLGTI